MLCITFGLTNKGNELISIDKVREKIEETFPEEKNFSDLLQRSKSIGSILVEGNNMAVTEIGIETAQNLCDSIRRTIKRRQSDKDEGPNPIIGLFLSQRQIEEMRNKNRNNQAR